MNAHPASLRVTLDEVPGGAAAMTCARVRVSGIVRLLAILVLGLLQTVAPYLHAHERTALQTGFHLHLSHALRATTSGRADAAHACQAAACSVADLRTDGESPDIGMPVELVRLDRLAPRDEEAVDRAQPPPVRAPPLPASCRPMKSASACVHAGRAPGWPPPWRPVSPTVLFHPALAPPVPYPA